MRFVVISDLHLRIPSFSDIKNTYKLHYLENNVEDKKLIIALRDGIVAKQRSCLEDLCNNIMKLKPDCLFITGDIFDNTYFYNSSSYENLDYEELVLRPNYILSDYELKGLFQQFLQKITENYIQVFIIPGNHDIANEEFWFNFSINSFVSIASSNKNTVLVYPFEEHNIEFMFYLLPYIRNNGSSVENNKDLFEKYLKQYLNIILDSSYINILFAHQFINLYTPFYNDEYFYDREDSINVDLLKKFNLVFLGHYHNVSNFFPYDGRIYVSGQAMIHDNVVDTHLVGGYLVDTFLNSNNKVNFNIRYIHF